MIRLSLGISFTAKHVKCVCINLDDMIPVHTLKVSLGFDGSFPLNYLAVIDEIFCLLQKEQFLDRVVCIRISAPETVAVLTNSNFFKNLMNFTGYAKSLREHFCDSFLARSYIGYESNNYSSWESWKHTNANEYNLPVNALKFSLNNYLKSNEKVLDQIKNIQFLSSFLTSILAGKKSPVDISCTWISGLQEPGVESSYQKDCFPDNSYGMREKLDVIKPFHEGFSYVAPYFVEKYGVYREALILTAGGHQAAVAVGSGGLVYLDTDEFLNLGAIVKGHADFDEASNICGLASDSRIQVAHTNFNQLFSQNQLELPRAIEWGKLTFSKSLENYSLLHFRNGQLIPDKELISNSPESIFESYLISYLIDIKKAFPMVSEMNICGEGKNNINFVKMVAGIFNCSVKIYDSGEYAAALGSALGGARRFKEEDYDVILNDFFNKKRYEEVHPDADSSSDFLSLIYRYESFQ